MSEQPQSGSGTANTEPNTGGSQLGFLITYGAMICGIAIATLDATGITTRAGKGSNGAVYTSIYLAIILIASAAVVPSAPKLAGRYGITRIFAIAVGFPSILWLAAGVLILSGVDPVPVLLIGAVGFGGFFGISTALSPLFARSYFDGAGMAGSVARLSVSSGLSWVIGSVGGGFMLDQVDPGWGLLARAALGLPFAVFLLLRPPAVLPQAPPVREGAWKAMFERLKTNRDLRRAALFGCGVSLFAAPMASLIVPIVDALRQSPLIPGAGILSAAMAVGELTSPVVVSKLQRHRTNLSAAAVASVVCAVFLSLYGVASLLTSHRTELVLWGIVGIGFGAMRCGGRALNIAAATDSGTDEDSAESVASFVFLTGLIAPIGVLMWGFLINRVSVEAAIAVGAVGTFAVSLAFIRSAKAAVRA